jgi:hypothetical protein
MFSALRKGLIYNNVSSDIVDHDLDNDVDLWSYDGKDVYRGSLDSEYLSHGLNVYWLYDDNSLRVGLAEHDSDSPEIFQALWFHDNPFATLLQDPRWKPSRTLWSMLANEAYQDCLENDFKNVSELALDSGYLLVTPKMLTEKTLLYTCENCGKKSLKQENICSTAKASDFLFSDYSVLFLDDDFVIYEKVTEVQQQPDASLQVLQEQNRTELPADLQESKDAETLQAELQESPPHHPQLSICQQQSDVPEQMPELSEDAK